MADHSPTVREQAGRQVWRAGGKMWREDVGKPQDASSKRLGSGWEVTSDDGPGHVCEQTLSTETNLKFDSSEPDISEWNNLRVTYLSIVRTLKFWRGK